MKIAIVYDSVTGNTKTLVDVIYDECKKEDVKLYNEFNDNILGADLIFIGSWTFKGEPCDKMKMVYQKIINKKIFVFGTCGFGGSQEYYKIIFDNTSKYIDKSNVVLDYYFCPGKLPYTVKQRYENALKENPNDDRMKKMLENFDNVVDRPNDADLNKLREKVRKVIYES